MMIVDSCLSEEIKNMLPIISKLFSNHTCKKSFSKRNLQNNPFQNYIEFIENNSTDIHKAECAKMIIALIVEYLNYEESLRVIEKGDGDQNNSLIEDIYSSLLQNLDLENDTVVVDDVQPDQVKYYNCVRLLNRNPIEISVNDLPILLNPWKKERILKNFKVINSKNEFDGVLHSSNINNHYLHPMGIVVCSGGNHSQLSARYRSRGRTIIKQIKDFSSLYEKVKFNGNNYIKIDNNSIIKMDFDQNILFYSGVIFELGRYLKDEHYCGVKDIQNILKTWETLY